MSLIDCDVDGVIASFIFNQHYRSGSETLKTIMLAFGRSRYDDFIEVCRRYYYKQLFRRFQVTSIEDLLKKLTHKKRVCHFPCYQTLQKTPLSQPLISFDRLNARHRLIVYYLSMYHGYVWVATKTSTWDSWERAYDHYRDFGHDKVVPYHLLKRKRIHNLENYELVRRAATLQESTFKLKEDVGICKRGVCKEIKDITCIRILTRH